MRKNGKKIILAILSSILVLGICTSGTLAYMAESQEGPTAVVNTVVLGNLIDPDAEPAPEIYYQPDLYVKESKDPLMNGFYILENYAEYNRDLDNGPDKEPGGYVLDSSKYVVKNHYDAAELGMMIPKNPMLTIDLVPGVEAYVFVRLINGAGTNVNVGSVIDTTIWKPLKRLAGINDVYCYMGQSIIGQPHYVDQRSGEPVLYELDSVPILSGEFAITGITDMDTSQPGTQIGTVEFEAYVCQAIGFTSPEEAYRACFGNFRN